MRIDIISIAVLACLTFCGCDSEKDSYYVQFDKIEGISTGDAVWISDKRVGRIISTNISKSYAVILEVSIQDSLPPLSTNSVFQIMPREENRGLGLFLLLNDGDIAHTYSDTIEGLEFNENDNQLQTISNALNTLESVLDTTKSDSLISELEALRMRVDSVEAVKQALDSMNPD